MGTILDRRGLEWQDEAECVNHDPDLWYSNIDHEIAFAQFICAGCPVATECLQRGRELGDDWAVWGGWTKDDRRNGRRAELQTSWFKRCRICRTKFETEDGKQKYCSQTCRDEMGRRMRATAQHQPSQWAPADLDKLGELIVEGHKAPEIARRLNRSVGSVKGAIRRHIYRTLS